MQDVDLLNIDFLRRFVVGEGKAAKIVSRFVTGLNAQEQKKVSTAVKRARQLNLL